VNPPVECARCVDLDVIGKIKIPYSCSESSPGRLVRSPRYPGSHLFRSRYLKTKQSFVWQGRLCSTQIDFEVYQEMSTSQSAMKINVNFSLWVGRNTSGIQTALLKRQVVWASGGKAPHILNIGGEWSDSAASSYGTHWVSSRSGCGTQRRKVPASAGNQT
jgi:hypothetical protein